MYFIHCTYCWYWLANIIKLYKIEKILLILEHNINHNDIEVFYQPCVKDGKIVAVETLLRYKYKEYLFPPLVIQIAKEKELYVDLSKVIIQKAVNDFKKC